MANNILDSGDHDHRSVLASVDKQGRRKGLYVAIVGGFWRRARLLVALFLIGFYIAAPLVQINGMPMVRIDIPNRHYILFGQIFWPQDFFYFLLLFLTAIIGTVALVSLLGRVFCGWICPHNVFLEMVYRPIERLFEGPAHRHRLRDRRGQGFTARRVGKWLAYALVTGVLANTATALFTGTEAFAYGLFINPFEHPAAATFFAFFFGLNYFNFVWFREQTCTIVCPYGRLQSALLDSDSLIVGYDEQRGEPRGKLHVAEGDCVDCHQCVEVCPTGIDIRNGTQMECIQCSACIDACNAVMEKVHKPINLIKYTTENQLAGGRLRLLRPRTMLYLVVWLVLLTVSISAILNRPLLQLNRLRDQGNTSLITTAEGEQLVTGAVRIAMINKTGQDLTADYALADGSPGRVTARADSLTFPANSRSEHLFRVQVPLTSFTQRYQDLSIELAVDGRQQTMTIPFRLMRHQPQEGGLDD